MRTIIYIDENKYVLENAREFSLDGLAAVLSGARKTTHASNYAPGPKYISAEVVGEPITIGFSLVPDAMVVSPERWAKIVREANPNPKS